MNSVSGKKTTPRVVLLGHLREIKRAVAETIRPWTRASYTGSVDSWNAVWQLAQSLRIKADALAVFAAQQAKATRQRDYDNRQHEIDTPNPTPGDTDAE